MKQTLALAWCLTSSLIIIRKSDEKTWRNISSRNDVGVARQCETMLNEKDVSITMKYESNSSQRLEHSEHCKLCTLWHVPTLAIVLMSAAAAASCFPCLEGIFVSTSARVFHVARDFFMFFVHSLLWWRNIMENMLPQFIYNNSKWTLRTIFYLSKCFALDSNIKLSFEVFMNFLSQTESSPCIEPHPRHGVVWLKSFSPPSSNVIWLMLA